MRTLKPVLFAIALTLGALAGARAATVVEVTGGGLALQTALLAAGPDTYLKIMDDTTTYTQDTYWEIGAAKSGLVIAPAPGKNPVIEIDRYAGIYVRDLTSGATPVNWTFGDPAGGRLKIIAKSGMTVGQLFWLGDNSGGLTHFVNCDFAGRGLTSGSGIYMHALAPRARTLTVEGCTFTNFKYGGGTLYINEAQWADADDEGTPTLTTANITRCTFQNTKLSVEFYAKTSHGDGNPGSQVTISQCVFKNDSIMAIWGLGKAGNVTVDRSWVQDCYEGIMVGDHQNMGYFSGKGGNMRVTNSVLLNTVVNTNPSAVSGRNNSDLTVDHCDLITVNAKSPIKGFTSTGKTLTMSVTNCNLISGSGVSLGEGPTSTGDYALTADYNNCPQGYLAPWVAGPHDKAVNPNYVDPLLDLTVQADALFNAANDGRCIGSALRMDSGTPSPVELSSFSAE